MEPLTWIALGVVALGVVGSALPLVPGGGLSVVGVLGYWWSTGYAEPSALLVAILVGVGLLTMLVDYFGGAVAARAGGASALTTAAAVLVGLFLLFVAGPVGFVLGIAATVFAVEFAQHADAEAGFRVALWATVGVLASTVVQVVLTGSVLVVLLLVAFV
ncbi:DUF456 domain-containing protein [Halobellus limi]|uniref:DUF456 domain-containing protein n=1 Tax=Halobellus limi TaxID=699433 RepID=A0A1H5U2V3_9EURY|nr:DUF456 domain-containing protein [Halobellus limi]QCC47158.1 DUF456 domain-containing protein [Halobellus limi]SEF69373.1 hypothetical protein SAMN04488133_0464 [Halobellus limi]